MDALADKIVARALGADAPVASAVRLRQRGSLRLDRGKPWLTFKAEQVIQATTTGFRWTASVRMAPLLRVKIVDAFETGRGRLVARLWGMIPLANASGPEIDTGELLRYMAELPWCPLAYRGNPSLSMRPVDETHLSVSMVTSGSPVSVTLEVDPQGDVTSVRAEQRPRLVGKEYVSSPWSGTYSEHGWFGAVRAPRAAVVRWHLDDGPFECFRGEIVSLEAE